MGFDLIKDENVMEETIMVIRAPVSIILAVKICRKLN